MDLNINSENCKITTTKRGVLLTVTEPQTTRLVFVPKVRSAIITKYQSVTVKLGTVLKITAPAEYWETIESQIMEAALGISDGG